VAMAYAMAGDGDEAIDLLDMINPLNHSATRDTADVYRVEPYVVVADVYAAPPHVGRGGWSWYTGSASWFYTVAVRNVLGIRTVAEGRRRYLVVDPCVPRSWKAFSAEVRFGTTVYKISVENPRGVNRGVDRITCDGKTVPGGRVAITDDGRTHNVVVSLLGG
jgi:cellobiose phosphorylase